MSLLEFENTFKLRNIYINDFFLLMIGQTPLLHIDLSIITENVTLLLGLLENF